MFTLGIDGGGTHTRLELRGTDDTFIKRAETGAFNMAALGEAGFRARLREIFELCGDMRRCEAICLGGAGISGGDVETVLRQELERAGFHGKLKLCGDHEIALAGAMEGPGCILISGTGSICCGRDAQGNMARAGGLGHIIDDGGSGYWLGREALAHGARALDGRGERDLLTERVLEKTGARTAQELVHFVYYSAPGKSHIAQVSKVVLACAQEGDSLSLALLDRGARELKDLVQTVCRKLNLENPRVALMGGLLETDCIYRQRVCIALEGIARPIAPESDALRGASRLAHTII